jgi:hypothetical protein
LEDIKLSEEKLIEALKILEKIFNSSWKIEHKILDFMIDTHFIPLEKITSSLKGW